MLLDMPPTYRRIQRPMDGERKRRRKKRETEGNRMVGLMPKKRTDKWQRKKKEFFPYTSTAQPQLPAVCYLFFSRDINQA
jgi:hypothetical protein